MQTFLPYPDFKQSAKVLDYRRLGKQRIEARTLLDSIVRRNSWTSHPASKMWTGYETALIHYGNIIIQEWVSRGYKNNMPIIDIDEQYIKMPSWLGNEEFHASHRSNLLRKDSNYYSQFGWTENNDLKYVWPLGIQDKL